MKPWGWALLGLVLGAALAWVLRSNRDGAALQALETRLAQETARAELALGAERVAWDSAAALDSLARQADSLRQAAQTARLAQRRALLAARLRAEEAAQAIGAASSASDSVAALVDALGASQEHASAAEGMADRLGAELEATGRLLGIAAETRDLFERQRDSALTARDRWRKLAEDAIIFAGTQGKRSRGPFGIPLPRILVGTGISLDGDGLRRGGLQITLGYPL